MYNTSLMATSVYLNDETQALLQSMAKERGLSGSGFFKKLLLDNEYQVKTGGIPVRVFSESDSINSILYPAMLSGRKEFLNRISFPQWLTNGLEDQQSVTDEAASVWLIGTTMLGPIVNNEETWRSFIDRGGYLRIIVSSNTFPLNVGLGQAQVENIDQKQQEIQVALRELNSQRESSVPTASIILKRSNSPILGQDTVIIARKSGKVDFQVSFKNSVDADRPSFRFLGRSSIDDSRFSKFFETFASMFEQATTLEV